jgi:indolepyruvate ferredoxin oxidoreductase
MTEVKLNNKFSLHDKYTLLEGRIILSGIQALVRLLLDQNRADLIKGLNTGTLVSGYRGSPVGMLDINLIRNKKLIDQHNIKFIPGVNEDLGATLIYGSQMAGMVSNVKYDGVMGMWYGKAPGVDRSGDIFRHANFLGVGKNGGVLAVAGDDPSCKSSTLPSQSEPALFDAMMPIFYPGNVQEILDLGRYAYEMSRYSGLWSGFKIVTDINLNILTSRKHSDLNQGFLEHFQDKKLASSHQIMLVQIVKAVWMTYMKGHLQQLLIRLHSYQHLKNLHA